MGRFLKDVNFKKNSMVGYASRKGYNSPTILSISSPNMTAVSFVRIRCMDWGPIQNWSEVMSRTSQILCRFLFDGLLLSRTILPIFVRDKPTLLASLACVVLRFFYPVPEKVFFMNYFLFLFLTFSCPRPDSNWETSICEIEYLSN